MESELYSHQAGERGVCVSSGCRVGRAQSEEHSEGRMARTGRGLGGEGASPGFSSVPAQMTGPHATSPAWTTPSSRGVMFCPPAGLSAARAGTVAEMPTESEPSTEQALAHRNVSRQDQAGEWGGGDSEGPMTWPVDI